MPFYFLESKGPEAQLKRPGLFQFVFYLILVIVQFSWLVCR